MEWPEEVKEKIVDLFCNTKHSLTTIWNIVDPTHELMNFEELYNFIIEYRDKDGNPLKRERKKDYIGVDETIFKLRQEGKSYFAISEELRKLGINVNLGKVSKMCKRIYSEKNMEEPIIKREQKAININDEELYELRKQKKSFKQISDYYKERGIDISATSIRMKCQQIYQRKNETDSLARYPYNIKSKEMYDSRIFELREKGMSYKAITEKLKSEGIDVSYEFIRTRAKIIYKKKDINERTRCRINNGNDEMYDAIYNLKNKGYTYKQICQEFNAKGIKCSHEKIRTISKKIFELKGEVEPRGHLHDKIKKEKLNELNKKLVGLYDLRKNGMSYEEISEYYKKQGIEVSRTYLSERCKEIFKEKGEKLAKHKTYLQEKITDEEIYALRKQGMSYKSMEDFYKKQGIDVSYQTLRKRCNILFFEKREKMPIVKRRPRRKTVKNSYIKIVKDKEYLITEMLKIGKKRRATEEQLKQFAKEISKIYGEDINLDVRLSEDKKERSL